MTGFPRPFLAHLTDGSVWEGCQFSNGSVYVTPPDYPGPGTPWVGLTLAALTEEQPHTPLHGARIEWADTPQETQR